jgi:hypothetical protein
MPRAIRDGKAARFVVMLHPNGSFLMNTEPPGNLPLF